MSSTQDPESGNAETVTTVYPLQNCENVYEEVSQPSTSAPETIAHSVAEMQTEVSVTHITEAILTTENKAHVNSHDGVNFSQDAEELEENSIQQPENSEELNKVVCVTEKREALLNDENELPGNVVDGEYYSQLTKELEENSIQQPENSETVNKVVCVTEKREAPLNDENELPDNAVDEEYCSQLIEELEENSIHQPENSETVNKVVCVTEKREAPLNDENELPDNAVDEEYCSQLIEELEENSIQQPETSESVTKVVCVTEKREALLNDENELPGNAVDGEHCSQLTKEENNVKEKLINLEEEDDLSPVKLEFVKRRLKDFNQVMSSIEGTPDDVISKIYYLLYLEVTQDNEMKNGILEFSGLLCDRDSAEFNLRVTYLNCLDEKMVKSIARALYLDTLSNKRVTIATMMNFLENPDEKFLRPTVAPGMLSDCDLDIDDIFSADMNDSLICKTDSLKQSDTVQHSNQKTKQDEKQNISKQKVEHKPAKKKVKQKPAEHKVKEKPTKQASVKQVECIDLISSEDENDASQAVESVSNKEKKTKKISPAPSASLNRSAAYLNKKFKDFETDASRVEEKTIVSEEKEEKPKEISPQSSVPSRSDAYQKRLRDFEAVVSSIEGTPEEILKKVQWLLHMKKAQRKERMDSILEFSGFQFSKRSSEFTARIKYLNNQTEGAIKDIARALYLEPGIHKKDIVRSIMGFLKDLDVKYLRPTVTVPTKIFDDEDDLNIQEQLIDCNLNPVKRKAPVVCAVNPIKREVVHEEVSDVKIECDVNDTSDTDEPANPEGSSNKLAIQHPVSESQNKSSKKTTQLRDFASIVKLVNTPPKDYHIDLYNLLYNEPYKQLSTVQNDILDFSGFGFTKLGHDYIRRKRFLRRMKFSRLHKLYATLVPPDRQAWVQKYSLVFNAQKIKVLTKHTMIEEIFEFLFNLPDYGRQFVKKSKKEKKAEKPVKEKPMVAKPVKVKPIVVKPVKEKPMVAKPVKDKPMVVKPMKEKPMVAKPVKEKPIVEKLSDLKKVRERVASYHFEYLLEVHKLLFMMDSNDKHVRSNLAAFEGFPFATDSYQYKKRRNYLKSLTNHNLCRISSVLSTNPVDMPRNELIDHLVKILREYAKSPSGKPRPPASSSSSHVPSKSKESLVKPKITLNDFEITRLNVYTSPMENLVDIHTLLYMAPCKPATVREGVLNFDGFSFKKGSLEYLNRKKFLDRRDHGFIKRIYDIIIPIDDDVKIWRHTLGPKEDNFLTKNRMIEELFKFLFSMSISETVYTGVKSSEKLKKRSPVKQDKKKEETKSLSDLNTVFERVMVYPTRYLQDIHLLLFMETCSDEDARQNILCFEGFPFGPQSTEFNQRILLLKSMAYNDLQMVSRVLCTQHVSLRRDELIKHLINVLKEYTNTSSATKTCETLPASVLVHNPVNQVDVSAASSSINQTNYPRMRSILRRDTTVSSAVASSSSVDSKALVNYPTPAIEHQPPFTSSSSRFHHFEYFDPSNPQRSLVSSRSNFGLVPKSMDTLHKSEHGADFQGAPLNIAAGTPNVGTYGYRTELPYHEFAYGPQIVAQGEPYIQTFPQPMHIQAPYVPAAPTFQPVVEKDEGFQWSLQGGGVKEDFGYQQPSKRIRMMSDGSQNKSESTRVADSCSLVDTREDFNSSSPFHVKIAGDPTTKVSEEDEDCNKPLSMLVGHPNDDMLKQKISEIVKNTDLGDITINGVIEKIFSMYPNFNLTYRKEFIKSTLRSLLCCGAEQNVPSTSSGPKTDADTVQSVHPNSIKECTPQNSFTISPSKSDLAMVDNMCFD